MSNKIVASLKPGYGLDSVSWENIIIITVCTSANLVCRYHLHINIINAKLCDWVYLCVCLLPSHAETAGPNSNKFKRYLGLTYYYGLYDCIKWRQNLCCLNLPSGRKRKSFTL